MTSVHLIKPSLYGQPAGFISFRLNQYWKDHSWLLFVKYNFMSLYLWLCCNNTFVNNCLQFYWLNLFELIDSAKSFYYCTENIWRGRMELNLLSDLIYRVAISLYEVMIFRTWSQFQRCYWYFLFWTLYDWHQRRNLATVVSFRFQ